MENSAVTIFKLVVKSLAMTWRCSRDLFSLTLVLILSAIPGVCQRAAPGPRAWEAQLNHRIIPTTRFILSALPELGMMFAYDRRYDNSVKLIDPISKTIASFGNPGPGPEEFHTYWMIGSDGSHIYGYDDIRENIHLYEPSTLDLVQVISTRSWIGKAGYSHRLLGLSKGNWIWKWQELPKGTTRRTVIAEMECNTLAYGVIGPGSKRLRAKFRIHNKKPGLMYRVVGIRDLLVHNISGDRIVIWNQEWFPKGKMTIAVLNLRNWSSRKVNFSVPLRFSRLGKDKYEDLKAKSLGFMFVSPDEHSPFPNMMGMGLDNLVYTIFFTEERDGQVETLINVLNPVTLRKNQFLYKGTAIPYLFDRQTVYCANLTDDAIRVLPRSVVCKRKLKDNQAGN